MNEHIKKLIEEMDRLVQEANPKDGSAPLGPIVMLGNLVNNNWKQLKTFLEN